MFFVNLHQRGYVEVDMSKTRSIFNRGVFCFVSCFVRVPQVYMFKWPSDGNIHVHCLTCGQRSVLLLVIVSGYLPDRVECLSHPDQGQASGKARPVDLYEHLWLMYWYVA